MNEDDTFNRLRRWHWEDVVPLIAEANSHPDRPETLICNEVELDSYFDKHIEKTGWTANEWYAVYLKSKKERRDRLYPSFFVELSNRTNSAR